MLLLICRTNVLSGDHINNYYQAMSLLWMSPVTETVSFIMNLPTPELYDLYDWTSKYYEEWFDGLPPSSCWQPIRRLDESYLAYFGHDACIWDPIWIVTQGLFLRCYHFYSRSLCSLHENCHHEKMHLCKHTRTIFDCSQVILEYCSVSGWSSQLSAVCFDSRICWWSNATNRSSVPILLFKICALSIKFASIFFS